MKSNYKQFAIDICNAYQGGVFYDEDDDFYKICVNNGLATKQVYDEKKHGFGLGSEYDLEDGVDEVFIYTEEFWELKNES